MRVRSTLAALAIAAGATVFMSSPASADTGCDVSDFCLYYNSNFGGAHKHFRLSEPDLAGYVYQCCSAGAGQPVKNNAASAKNDFTGTYVRVFYNSNYAGPYDTFAPQQSKNLVNTYNDNASLLMY
ncbi:peptidase M23 [Streptomyces sp. ETH9427]|uniref:peptidase inhibitor family I36 protein n=1 Tax=Streptomyces sp. E1N211 TaxID=1851876 RepID=UPI000E0B66FE|nr:peptidase inhibitor family I36 protein [Streptomyces sp. E1N211]AXI89597.1 peptidase M23 [Streptomyces sp. ETH9427]